jgi:hypothetical protein
MINKKIQLGRNIEYEKHKMQVLKIKKNRDVNGVRL